MCRCQSWLPVLLPAILWMLIHPALTNAEEKSFEFNKDIQVMPANEKPANKIGLSLSVDKTRVNPGDTVLVRFQTDQDAYLRLLGFGTSGKVTQLWPNKFSGANNRVQAGRRYSFPSESDKFLFRVSGPTGLERIVAVATEKPDAIVREEDLGDFEGGFKSYQKEVKDLVVESRRRVGSLPQGSKWATACVTVAIGGVPDGGRIRSRNVYLLGVAAATSGLRFCDDDLKAFSRLMGDKLGIPDQNKRLLFGPDATRQGFVDGIRWLASKTQPEDLVFIYFSGHGTLIPDEAPAQHPDGLSSALVCYHNRQNLTRQDPDLKQILLASYDLANLVKEVPAQRRFFVVDACHSGAITKDVSPDMTVKYLPLLSEENIRQIREAHQKELRVVSAPDSSASAYQDVVAAKESLLAACAKPEPSYEDRSKKAGLFTYWLVANMAGRGNDLQSAFRSAKDKVVEETGSMTRKQTPQIIDEHGLAAAIKF